jgi:hypothetical protein
LRELAGVRRESVPVLLRQRSNRGKLLSTILQRVSINRMRGEGEHLRGHAHKANVLGGAVSFGLLETPIRHDADATGITHVLFVPLH